MARDEIITEAAKRGVKCIEGCNTPTRQGLYITVNKIGLSPGWTYFSGLDKENNTYIVESLGF